MIESAKPRLPAVRVWSGPFRQSFQWGSCSSAGLFPSRRCSGSYHQTVRIRAGFCCSTNYLELILHFGIVSVNVELRSGRFAITSIVENRAVSLSPRNAEWVVVVASERRIEHVIQAGEQNRWTMELVRNWCAHARVEKFGGVGLIEAGTGLPIGHHSVRCDHASEAGMKQWPAGSWRPLLPTVGGRCREPRQ
jgi:hypothetical protein